MMILSHIYRIFPRIILTTVIIMLFGYVFVMQTNTAIKETINKNVGPDDLLSRLEMADFYLSRGDLKNAEIEVSEALVFDSKNIYALEKFSKIKNPNETYREIIKLEKTLMIRPDYQAAWLKLANLYENVGRDDLAGGAREKAAKLTTI